MKDFLVKDWMTKKVITVGPHTSTPDAGHLMRLNKIRRLPVVDKKGKVIGIVTRSDIREASPSDATTLSVWELNYLLAKLQVADIMTKNPVTIHPDNTLMTAAKLLYKNKIGALPVVDDNNVIQGILTESDIFRVFICWMEEECVPG